MIRVRHATQKLRHYASRTRRTLWTRFVRGLHGTFRSHAAWSARAASAPPALRPPDGPSR